MLLLMAWTASSRCLQCGKKISRRKAGGDFCSSVHAQEYFAALALERLRATSRPGEKPAPLAVAESGSVDEAWVPFPAPVPELGTMKAPVPEPTGLKAILPDFGTLKAKVPEFGSGKMRVPGFGTGKHATPVVPETPVLNLTPDPEFKLPEVAPAAPRKLDPAAEALLSGRVPMAEKVEIPVEARAPQGEVPKLVADLAWHAVELTVSCPELPASAAPAPQLLPGANPVRAKVQFSGPADRLILHPDDTPRIWEMPLALPSLEKNREQREFAAPQALWQLSEIPVRGASPVAWAADLQPVPPEPVKVSLEGTLAKSLDKRRRFLTAKSLPASETLQALTVDLRIRPVNQAPHALEVAALGAPAEIRRPKGVSQVESPAGLPQLFDSLTLPGFTPAIREAGARMAPVLPPKPLPLGYPDLIAPVLDTAIASGFVATPLYALPAPAARTSPVLVMQPQLDPWLVPARPRCPLADFQPISPKPWELEPVDTRMALAPTTGEHEIPAPKRSEWIEKVEARRRHPLLGPVADFWYTSSLQVKLLAAALPILAYLAVRPSEPNRVQVAQAPPPAAEVVGTSRRSPVPVETLPQAMPPAQPSAPVATPGQYPAVPVPTTVRSGISTENRQLEAVKKALLDRAAINFADDFQTGLDAWESRSKNGPGWTYDQTGFVRPRNLAVFRPSMAMQDYTLEFLAKLDQRAVSWVVRAVDLENYTVVKLVQKTPGPVPQMALVHYPVLQGREGYRKETPLPLTVYKDSLFRIRLDVQGPHHTVSLQNQVVDYWHDPRLPAGGVGFFCSRGEEARIRWVQVTYQNDTLGKLCAFLTPYVQ
jgi:hypothetical protein